LVAAISTFFSTTNRNSRASSIFPAAINWRYFFTQVLVAVFTLWFWILLFSLFFKFLIADLIFGISSPHQMKFQATKEILSFTVVNFNEEIKEDEHLSFTIHTIRRVGVI